VEKMCEKNSPKQKFKPFFTTAKPNL